MTKREAQLLQFNHAFVDDLQASVFNHLALVRHASFEVTAEGEGPIDCLNTRNRLPQYAQQNGYVACITTRRRLP